MKSKDFKKNTLLAELHNFRADFNVKFSSINPIRLTF